MPLAGVLEAKQTQVMTAPKPLLENYWIMFYKHGMGSNLMKGFYCKGDKGEAIRRAAKHCEVMKYRLLLVRPLISDLEEDEGVKSNAREGEIVP